MILYILYKYDITYYTMILHNGKWYIKEPGRSWSGPCWTRIPGSSKGNRNNDNNDDNDNGNISNDS